MGRISVLSARLNRAEFWAMIVTETRLGLFYGLPNARHIARLKLLALEDLLYLATPEEIPVDASPHTVSQYGISVAEGAPLVELVFPVGGCTMQETSQSSGEGRVYDLELSAVIPRNEPRLIGWAEANRGREWVALMLDQNGAAYIAGEPENGLALFTGRSIREANAVTLTLRGRSWHSLYFLESFDSAALFAETEFDLEFGSSFNA